MPELGSLLTQYRRDGERSDPRPDYPIAALCQAGLWTLDTTDPVPSAHGDADLCRWFEERQPTNGLPESIYRLLHASGVARVKVIAAVVDKFFDDIDHASLIADVGLDGVFIAADAPPGAEASVASASSDPHRVYQDLVDAVSAMESTTHGKRRATTSHDPIRLAAARRAVILRSEGECENPSCGNRAPDVTDCGLPVLEVDHIADIATGGRDHPIQMIALCPNCHAVKTRGRSRHQLREQLLTTARERHHEWTKS
ncbi:HNH endonuclease signature motif containing protein [Nocardia sp. CDC160]|uniref:HNH endonuclease signature motif containing protein n=1 Tax=Nocardia sp. CDC160 TaxID=3112166 RepID=UPI002DC003B5|nr:HNH endonuclease signature motif containing protein [Nocardia sp. CDC160]MEC3920307.1 HNH endonuclease signature motif containing protein [Nocardia sp. CDC160]